MDKDEISQIKDLMRELDKSSLSKIVLKKDNFTLEIQKPQELKKEAEIFKVPVKSMPSEDVSVKVEDENGVKDEAKDIKGDYIKSPMVGTFYKSPSPDSAPFVKVGDKVDKGQVIAILEAMKIMNEFEAEFDCKILKVLVEDSQPIEYDMPLFLVEKL